jgi:hypothetical protein
MGAVTSEKVSVSVLRLVHVMNDLSYELMTCSDASKLEILKDKLSRVGLELGLHDILVDADLVGN